MAGCWPRFRLHVAVHGDVGVPLELFHGQGPDALDVGLMPLLSPIPREVGEEVMDSLTIQRLDCLFDMSLSAYPNTAIIGHSLDYVNS